jgi:hypothetical protein
VKKTVFDKSALTVIGAICIIAIAVSGFKAIHLHNIKCPDAKILVSAPNVVENAPFTVSCISPGVSTCDWDFGDNTQPANGTKVTHTYRSAGKYNLKLVVNGSEKCTTTLSVVVGQDLSATSVSGDVIESSIEGPATATVGKPVKYHETSGKGTSWAWTSSESTGIDGTGQEVTYTFSSPGKKTIYVSINGNKGKASLDVDVAGGGGGGGGGSTQKVTEDEFRKMLLQVVNRKADVNVFKDCVCGKINMVITVVDKKGKPYALDGYCKEIRDRAHRTDFDEIKLTTDPKTGCITNIVIKEHSGALAPWRK